MLNQIIHKTTLLAGISLLSLGALAQQQDSLLRDNVIDVVKTFQPVLSEAIRIPVQPNPEKPEIKRPDFNYSIEPQNLKVSPTIYTIKPLSVGTMLLPKLKNNYVKIGAGNYNLPLAEVYIGSVRNKQYQAGFFAKHHSANGNDAFSNFSNNTMYGYGKRYIKNGVIGADAYYHRNAVFLYGRPNDQRQLLAEPKLVYNIYDLKTHYQHFGTDSNKLSYKAELNYYHFNHPGAINENDVQIKGLVQKTGGELPFEIESSLRINNNLINQPLFPGELSFRRTFFNLNPQIFMTGDAFYLKGGFNGTIASDSTGSKAYIFPKAEGGFHLIPKKVTVLAGFRGNLTPNTYRSILSENPFATHVQVLNTINRFEIYGGFKGEIGPQTSFHLISSSARIENMLFYSHDSAKANQFSSYDTSINGRRGRLITLNTGLTHQWGEKWRSSLQVSVYNYELSSLQRAYSRPDLEVKLNTTYNIGDKFLLKLDIFHWGERWGRQTTVVPQTYPFTDVEMPAFTDINFGIDYRYNKNFSAFLQLNNIANNRYERFLAYPVYGFNILGGFTFTF
jgi:hypothetical protein